MGGQADPGRPGFWDQLAASPAFNMGMGILANNQGHYGAWGPALGKGVQQGVQTTQQAREAEMMAEYRRAQAAAQAQEAKLKAQQEAAWQAAYPTGGQGAAPSGTASASPAQHLAVLEQLAIQSRNSKLLADVQDLKLKLMQADPSYAYQQQFAQESAKSMFAPYQEVKGAKGEPVYLRPGERLGGGGTGTTPPRGASPAEVEDDVGQAKIWNTRHEKALNASSAASSKLQTLQAMESLLPKISTGKAAPIAADIKGWVQAMGWPIDVDKLGATEAFDSMSKQLALEARNPSGGAGMPGAMSDSDRAYLNKMVPVLEKSPQGNVQLIAIHKKIAQRDIEVAELLTNFRETYGRIDGRAEAALRQYAERNPLFGR